MERTTKTIDTPGGHKVVVKDYLTGREVNQVRKALFGNILADVEKDPVTGLAKSPKYPLGQIVDREDKLIEVGVISLDDKTEGAAEAVKDLPHEDYATVVKELESLAKGNF